ncbi:MAG: FG-GAP-like repeat-containing protein [Polyangiales bacterium]
MLSSRGVSARTRSFQRCVAALAVCAAACAQGNPDEPDGAVTDVVTEVDAAKADAPDVPSPADAPDVVDAPSTLDIPDVPSPVDVPDVSVPDEAAVDAGPSCAFAMCGDRCVDTATDPRNCGACGNDCGALPGVDPSRVACRAGACDVASACLAGRAHCSTNPADGCEADVTTASRCGSCSTACTGDSPVCGPSAGGRYACQSGCVAPTSTRCGSTCVDTTSDIVHCGACGRACAPATGGVPTCAASVCGVRCVSGYHSCGGVCASNASVDTCGAACAPCPAPLNGSATCDGTACGFACNAGFHRCGSACASDTSPSTCGASCSPCTAPTNATPTCDGTACGFACNSGFTRMGSACVAIAAPRLVAPLSTAFVTSRRPTLRWALAAGTDGAQVDLCRDRACAMVTATLNATGSSVTPSTDINAGLVYWRVRGAVGASRGTANSPVWQFTVLARGASVDTSWGTALDVNGDGYSDLAVGQPQVGGQPGRAFVFHGSASGASRTASASLTGPDGSGLHYFGYSVASAGDVNGDGYADVVVGATDAASDGRAYVYLGGPSGLALEPSVVLTPPSGARSFGASVSGAGDVDGDGFSDVVVGAPGPAGGATNTAVIFYGSASSPLGGRSAALTWVASGATASERQNQRLGETVSSVGDVNGDGFADVEVGMPSVTSAILPGVVVFRGARGGVVTTAEWLLREDTARVGTDFGASLAP